MSIQKIPLAGFTFEAEFTTALLPVTGSGTPTPAGSGILTYTTTGAHGLVAGQAVTFTGAVPTTYNTTTFVVLSVPTTTTFTIYTIPPNSTTSLGQVTTAGSAVPVFLLGAGKASKAGMFFMSLGANAVVQYNPDNTGYVDCSYIQPSTNTTVIPTDSVSPSVPVSVSGATWRTVIAASATGMVWSDSYGVRVICSGSAGTSHWSRVE